MDIPNPCEGPLFKLTMRCSWFSTGFAMLLVFAVLVWNDIKQLIIRK